MNSYLPSRDQPWERRYAEEVGVDATRLREAVVANALVAVVQGNVLRAIRVTDPPLRMLVQDGRRHKPIRVIRMMHIRHANGGEGTTALSMRLIDDDVQDVSPGCRQFIQHLPGVQLGL